MSYRVLHPRPVYVVVTSHGKEVAGCAASWVTPVNAKPLYLVVALAYERYTYELVMKSSELTVNVVGREFLEGVKYVGTVSTRDDPAKFRRAGFRFKPSKRVRSPSIEGALATVECVVRDIINLPDHALLVCEAVHVEFSEKYFKEVFAEEAEVLLHVGKDVYAVPKYLRG